MRLKHLSLSNFKQHRKLSRDLDAEVVGITGLNHTGKTTLLRAIRWLLTSKLDGSQANHVYGYSQLGVDTASGSLTFEKGGHTGTITRTLGASSKRTLVWDGVEYKKSADVDEKMEEILGADLGTVDKVMFIRQGELASALFGTPADREKLFMTILDVGYLSKSADALEDKIKVYEAGGVQNLGEILTTLTESIEEGESVVRNLASKLLTKRGGKEDLRRFRIIQQRLENNSQMGKELRSNRHRIAMLNETLTSQPDLKSLKHDLGTLNTKYQELDLIRGRIQQNADNLKSLAYWERIKLENTVQLAEAESQLAQLHSDSHLIKDSWGYSQHLIGELSSVSCAGVPTMILNLAQDRKVLEEVEVKLERLSQDLHKLGAEVTEAGIKAEAATQTLALSDYALEFVRMRKKGLECCPMCAGKLDEDLDSEAETKALAANANARKEVTETKNAHSALGVSFLKTHSDSENLKAKKSDLAKRIVEYTNSLSELFGKEDPATVLEAHVKLQALITVNVLAISKLEPKIKELKTSLSQCDVTMAMIPPAEDVDSPENLDEILQEVKDSRAAIETKILNMEKVLAAIAEIEFAQGRLLQAADKNMKDLELDIPGLEPDYVETCSKYPNILERDISIAETQAKEADELEGALNAYGKQITDLKAKLLDAQARARDNEVREDFINQLREARDIFRKGALPTMYVEKKFGELCEASKEFLGRTDATFEVERDPETTVGFIFREMDTETPVWQPQENLSGGQRVRLSIAFLIAVQQILVPDIGLLILDEPTQHVDEPGVESLQELFASMGDILASSDSQIIICDHNEKLIPAYKIHINL